MQRGAEMFLEILHLLSFSVHPAGATPGDRKVSHPILLDSMDCGAGQMLKLHAVAMIDEIYMRRRWGVYKSTNDAATGYNIYILNKAVD